MMIETKRLLLRGIKVEDKQAIFQYRSNAEANKYQGWIPKTIEDVDTFFSKLAPSFNQHNTWFQLAIIEKTTNFAIGDIGVHFIGDNNEQVELGFTLAEEKQGQGYATESVWALIDYLFTKLNKHRITASVDPRNKASINLLAKLNFRKEAHFVESYFQDGHWQDDIVYALLRREWKEIHNL